MRIDLTKRVLLIECIIIFAVLPLALSLYKPRGAIYMILWLVTLAAYALLHRKHSYKFRTDWNWPAVNRENVLRMLKRFAPLGVILFVFTIVMVPDRLFSLPLERPQTWVMVMILYPVLSVFAQEILFRSFFFERYRALFSPGVLFAFSALAFGWMHIILQNWVAVTFCVIGGLIFGDTYRRHRSLALVCIEHALYGCWVFTLGLGVYFYHGHAVK